MKTYILNKQIVDVSGKRSDREIIEIELSRDSVFDRLINLSHDVISQGNNVKTVCEGFMSFTSKSGTILELWISECQLIEID